MSKEKISPWRRIRRHYERATLQCLRGELGGTRLVLYGCREILSYGRERIVLSVADPDVSAVLVTGTGLLCLSYHADAVVIEGCIDGVTLCRCGWDGIVGEGAT